MTTVAPDVVLHSLRIDARRNDEMRKLLGPHFAIIKDVRYFADVGDRKTRAQFYRANVLGEQVEVATRVELNDQVQIKEITVYFPPLPGLTALAAGQVPPIVSGRNGPVQALVARLLVGAMARGAGLGDRLMPWFVST